MDNLKNIIESILFVAGDGVDYSDIATKLDVDLKEVEKQVNLLKTERELNKSGIQIVTYNGKAQLSSNPDYAEEIAEVLNPIREKQLTRAVMEVCTIIAYKQPITRLEVENIRGVNSDYAISSLLDNEIIEVVGRKDAVGKPLLFGTTDKFLKKFNLNSLEDLPDYDELLNRIKVLHEQKPEDNSLYDFRPVGDEFNKDTNSQSETKVSNNDGLTVNITNSIININSEDGSDKDLLLDEMSDEELQKFLDDSKNNENILGKEEIEDALDKLSNVHSDNINYKDYN